MIKCKHCVQEIVQCNGNGTHAKRPCSYEGWHHVKSTSHYCFIESHVAEPEGLPTAKALRVAQELHRFYRAAYKALGRPGIIAEYGPEHDHGWKGCHKQKYFLRRAEALLKEIEQ